MRWNTIRNNWLVSRSWTYRSSRVMYRWLNGTSSAGGKGRRKGTQGLQSRGLPVSQATAEWEGQKRVAVNSLPFGTASLHKQSTDGPLSPLAVSVWFVNVPNQKFFNEFSSLSWWNYSSHASPLRQIVTVSSNFALRVVDWKGRGGCDVTTTSFLI